MQGVNFGAGSQLSNAQSHFVQFFESDAALSDTVARFVGAGLLDDAGVLVVATAEHIESIEKALSKRGIDVQKTQASGQLLFLDAQETLASFLRDGEPDRDLFNEIIGGLVQKLGSKFAKVHAYGEMVGLLWKDGNAPGTIALEQLWNDLGRVHPFMLLCGYDLHGFGAREDAAAFAEVCAAHSHVLPTASFLELQDRDEQLRAIALLQQQAVSLAAELKRREKAEAELVDFFENSVVPLHWVGPDGTILRANRAELDLLGYTEEEYVGRHIAQFHADSDTINDILTCLTKGQSIHSYRARLKCKDGSIKHVLIDSNVYFEDGKFIHTRCFTRDITDQIEAEASLTEHKQLEQTRLEEQRRTHLIEQLEHSKAAIENERENFRNLFEQTPEMVCILRGPDHVFEFVNEAHVKALGFDATGKSVREAQPESVEVHGILDEVYRTGKTAQLHEIPVTVTDRLRYFNLTYSARRDQAGAIDGIMILGTEVTEQVQARRLLKDSAQALEHAVAERTCELESSRGFLNSVVENIPHMVFIKDADTLRFVSFNRAGEELLGISRTELLGKSDYDFFPKEQADLFISKDREVLSGRKVVDVPEESIETRVKGRRTLRTRKIPILSPDGKPVYLLGVSEDITEWKEAEEGRLSYVREQATLAERKRENERAAFLAEASTILASSLDYHKTLKELARLVVPALADWCTVTVLKEDRTKERVAVVHHDERKKTLIEELAEYYPADAGEDAGIGHVIRTGKTLFTPCVNDAELVAAARDERHLEIMRELACHSCIVVPIFSRGKTMGAISVVSARRDRLYNENDRATVEEFGRRAGIAIDNALLYEAAQKAIAARDEFMSIASHELKTPLTSLKLQAQIRAREISRGEFKRFSPEKLPQLIADDERQVNRLTRLVDDMLDISRIQSGKLSLSAEDFDLNDLVEDVLSRFSAQIEASGSKTTFIKGRPAPGHWDRFRIEQVLVNLLTNALKYGDGSPIRIETSIDGKRAALSISDRGMGIKSEDLGRIFGQFERAVSAHSISGLGLGLYISRMIIEAHQGQISVHSEEGKGSTFTVELPLEMAAVQKLTARATEHRDVTRERN